MAVQGFGTDEPDGMVAVGVRYRSGRDERVVGCGVPMGAGRDADGAPRPTAGPLERKVRVAAPRTMTRRRGLYATTTLASPRGPAPAPSRRVAVGGRRRQRPPLCAPTLGAEGGGGRSSQGAGWAATFSGWPVTCACPLPPPSRCAARARGGAHGDENRDSRCVGRRLGDWDRGFRLAPPAAPGRPCWLRRLRQHARQRRTDAWKGRAVDDDGCEEQSGGCKPPTPPPPILLGSVHPSPPPPLWPPVKASAGSHPCMGARIRFPRPRLPFFRPPSGGDEAEEAGEAGQFCALAAPRRNTGHDRGSGGPPPRSPSSPCAHNRPGCARGQAATAAKRLPTAADCHVPHPRLRLPSPMVTGWGGPHTGAERGDPTASVSLPDPSHGCCHAGAAEGGLPRE